MAEPRRFRLERAVDHSGVSGTGVVAHGVLWPDGGVTVRWAGEHASTVVWSGIADVEHVHGHGGTTQIVWLDPGRAEARAATEAGHYFSTHCLHGHHDQCKGTCKHCPAGCRCDCHITVPGRTP